MELILGMSVLTVSRGTWTLSSIWKGFVLDDHAFESPLFLPLSPYLTAPPRSDLQESCKYTEQKCKEPLITKSVQTLRHPQILHNLLLWARAFFHTVVKQALKAVSIILFSSDFQILLKYSLIVTAISFIGNNPVQNLAVCWLSCLLLISFNKDSFSVFLILVTFMMAYFF